MFFSEDNVAQQFQSVRVLSADSLEQAQLVQEYHLVVLMCTACHKDLHKERRMKYFLISAYLLHFYISKKMLTFAFPLIWHSNWCIVL